MIKDGSGSYKQKGVDILMAIDMLTKAYESHYDVAVLLAGDDDLVDLVKAVKDAGKRVYGAFFKASCSKRLRDSFDRKHYLDNNINTIFLDATLKPKEAPAPPSTLQPSH